MRKDSYELLNGCTEEEIIYYVTNMFRDKRYPRRMAKDWQTSLEIAIHDLRKAEFLHNESNRVLH